MRMNSKSHDDECRQKQIRKVTLSAVVMMILMTVFFQHTIYGSSLTGIVRNDLGQPQPFVSLEFYSAIQDTLIRRVDTDSKGMVNLDSITNGEYKLKIPAHDTFPEQWYYHAGNTRFAQYTVWIGPAVQSDTLQFNITMHPQITRLQAQFWYRCWIHPGR